MKRGWLLAVGVVLLTILAPVQAQDDRLTVVASTTIVADVVQQVAGDAADVVSLMRYGQDPHTFAPSGQDIALLDEADVVFINGAGFEARLLPILQAGTAGELVEISACVNILRFGLMSEYDEHEEDDDLHHEDEVEHYQEGEDTDHDLETWCDDYYKELGLMYDKSEAHLGDLHEISCGIHEHDEADDHEEGDCDPHVWMDVQNVMLWTLYARDMLSELDPMHAEVYAANAAAYIAELQTLDTDIEAIISAIPPERRVLVTNHDTFSYWAYRYNFTVVGTVIPGGSTTAEPSAEDVAALIEVIEDYGVPAIFTENTVSNTLATQLGEATGAKVYQLYSDSLTTETSAYVDYMRHNATVMAGALGQ